MEKEKALWKVVVVATGTSYVGAHVCDGVDVDAFPFGDMVVVVPYLYSCPLLLEIYCPILDEACLLDWFGRDFPPKKG